MRKSLFRLFRISRAHVMPSHLSQGAMAEQLETRPFIGGSLDYFAPIHVSLGTYASAILPEHGRCGRADLS